MRGKETDRCSCFRCLLLLQEGVSCILALSCSLPYHFTCRAFRIFFGGGEGGGGGEGECAQTSLSTLRKDAFY